MRRHAAVLVAAAWVALALGTAGPVQAADGDRVACQFSGLSGQMVPPNPALTSDLTPNFESGSYNLSAQATCAGVVASSGMPFTQPASFTSSGSYSSLYCGTTTWTGPAGGTYIGISALPDFNPVGYTIRFVGGQGVVELGAPNHTGAFSGAGYAQITPEGAPSGADNCVTGSVQQFRIDGSFVALDPGPPGPVDPPPVDPFPGTAQPSATCTSPTRRILEGNVGPVQPLLIEQENPTSTWVCVRVAVGGVAVGGRLTIESPAVGPGGPTVDDSSSACHMTPGNQVPPPHPLIKLTVADTDVLFDTWASGTEVWACLGVESVGQKRVKIAVPGLIGGGVSFAPDEN